MGDVPVAADHHVAPLAVEIRQAEGKPQKPKFGGLAIGDADPEEGKAR